METAVAIANKDDFSVNTNIPLIGSMIGRASHADPWGVLATADVEVFERGRRSRDGDEPPSVARGVRRVLRRDTGTVRDHEGWVCRAVHGHLVHPIQNLFYGEPNAKRWRRAMDDALKRDVAKNPDVSVSELLARTLREGSVATRPWTRRRAPDTERATRTPRRR